MLRVLVIGDAEREAVNRLVAWAMEPANYYRIGPDAKIPGTNPKYVIRLNDFRCVFTITDNGEMLWRHLSVSVPAPNKIPNPIMFEEIAKLFGFKGDVEDWAREGHVDVNRRDNCVVLVQEFKP